MSRSAGTMSPAPADTPGTGPPLSNAERYGTLRYGPPPAKYADERGNDEQHDGDEEDDLGGLDRNTRDAAEAEQRGNQRDDEKRDGPAQHGSVLSVDCIWTEERGRAAKSSRDGRSGMRPGAGNPFFCRRVSSSKIALRQRTARMAGLKTYHAKRHFGVTGEPKGKVAR